MSRRSLVFLVLAACGARPAAPPATAAPALAGTYQIDGFSRMPDADGCWRRVAFDLVDLASGTRSPAVYCITAQPPDDGKAWFWLDGTAEVKLPAGTAVLALRVRASDVDPEGRRPMRVAIWSGTLDGARSGGGYAGRSGRITGGGLLFFDAPKGVPADLVLSLELDGETAPPARGAAVFAVGRATFAPGTPPCRFEVTLAIRGLSTPAAPTGRFCTRAIERPADDGAWFRIRGDLHVTLGGDDVVLPVESWEQDDPDVERVRHVVWRGRAADGRELFAVGQARFTGETEAEFTLRARLR